MLQPPGVAGLNTARPGGKLYPLPVPFGAAENCAFPAPVTVAFALTSTGTVALGPPWPTTSKK